MAEISIYKANETDFITNGSSLIDATICIIEEELNGKYTLELEYPIFGNEKHLLLVEENIIKADGQLFRIHKSIGSLGYKQIFARHIFYDLLHNFLEDVRPTDMNGTNALNWILDNTQYPHNFRGVSDIGTIATQYYVRKNPVEAMLGSDSLSTRWGGEIERDNFIIRFLRRRGSNKGAKIAYGKNLLGLEVERDMDTIATRIMPVGNDGLMLPEKYVDSPLIDNYNRVYIKTADVNIGVVEGGEDTEAVTEEQAFTFMRDAVNNLYVLDKIDIPYININADLLLLENTEEYKHLKHLSKVKLGDTVSCTDNPLQVEFEARVIKVKKNILTGNNEEVELGQFKKGLSDTIKDVIDKVRDEIEGEQSDLEAAIDRATDLITSALGGYVIKREGEILIMDTEDTNTATKVWRFNLNGLGYSGTGIDGPYRLAMTMDGEFVADFITTGVLNASLLKSGMIKAQIGDDFWNIENGHFKMGGMEQDENGFRINVGDKPLEDFVQDEVNTGKEYSDKEIKDLRDFLEGDFSDSHLTETYKDSLEDLKRTTKADKESIDVEFNNVYSNKNLMGDSKTDLYNKFSALNTLYYTFMTDLEERLTWDYLHSSDKQTLLSKLDDYLDYLPNFNTSLKNAITFINNSVDNKLDDLEYNIDRTETTANDAQAAADNAITQVANNTAKVDDMFSDNRLTPSGKKDLLRIKQEIQSEMPGLIEQNRIHSIGAYQVLIARANNFYIEVDKATADMENTTTIDGDFLRFKLQLYNDIKMQIINAVAVATKNDLDDKLYTHNLRTELELSLDTARLQAKYIDLVGSVTILSGLVKPGSDGKRDLGTLNLGRILGKNMDINATTGKIDVYNGAFRVFNDNGSTVVIDGKDKMLRFFSEKTYRITPGQENPYIRTVERHNLGYVPNFLAYQVDTPGDLPGGVQLPAMSIGGGTSSLGVNSVIRVSVDETNVYLEYKRGSNYPANAFSVKINIFKEEMI